MSDQPPQVQEPGKPVFPGSSYCEFEYSLQMIATHYQAGYEEAWRSHKARTNAAWKEGLETVRAAEEKLREALTESLQRQDEERTKAVREAYEAYHRACRESWAHYQKAIEEEGRRSYGQLRELAKTVKGSVGDTYEKYLAALRTSLDHLGRITPRELGVFGQAIQCAAAQVASSEAALTAMVFEWESAAH